MAEWSRNGLSREARSGSARQNLALVFYVYVLKSLKNKDIYIGYSTDLKTRYHAHKSGRVKSTKNNKPWILIYYEACRSKKDATKREKQLKMHAAKQSLLNRLQDSKNIKN